jgi:DNA polymerase sigma
LSTELSDIDIQIYDEKIKDERKFGKYLKKVLKNENLNIEAHLKNKNAPPVITISYDISEEYLTGINFSDKYSDGIEDLKKIKIDITFTSDTERVKNTKETVRIIKETLKRYKQLKPIILYLKIFFKKHELYSTYKGGINSLSIFCIARNILVTYEKYGFDVNLFPKEKILFLITEKFGNYNYQYGIDKDGFDYTLKDKEIVEKEEDLRLIIKSPVDNEKNIAYGSFKSREIIEKFHLLFDYINKNNLV